MESLTKLIQLIDRHESFVIIMHEQPDGDTIASSLAFAMALGQMNKTVQCVGKDPIPKPFRFLPGIESIQADFLAGDYEVMIVLDCGDLRRTGFPQRVRRFAQRQKRVVHIDHHQQSDLYKLANIQLFDSAASATGQILYRLFQALPIMIDANIATCLLTSLYYDTGAFKHANTTNEVLRLAAQLLHLGGRLSQITRHVELTKSIASLKLWGIALARAKHHPEFKIVISLITQADLAKSGAKEADAAGIVNLLNAVPEARAAILLTETADGQIRASLRTEQPSVDVARLAGFFGGGGLRRASGFCIPGQIEIYNNRWKVKIGY